MEGTWDTWQLHHRRRDESRTAPWTHPGRAWRASVYAYARAAVTSEPPSNGAAARDVYAL